MVVLQLIPNNLAVDLIEKQSKDFRWMSPLQKVLYIVITYTGYVGLLHFDHAALITMGSWYYALGVYGSKTVFSLLFSKHWSVMALIFWLEFPITKEGRETPLS